MTPERKEEALKDLKDMLDSSVKTILKDAALLMQERETYISEQDLKAGGPMVTPKDLLVALLLREAWQWGPVGSQVEIKVSRGSISHAKRSIQNIRYLRASL